MAIAARTTAELEETADQVRALERRCCVIPADVTRPEDCRRIVETAVRELGGLEILVNNAGAATFKPVWEYTDEDLDFHYAVNFRSMYVCSREALAHMLRRRRGSIINIASSSGKKPYARQGPYCAMKAAVISLSKVMALELRDYGIRVHAVCPGAVDTRMADVVHPERDREGWIQAEDVAEAVLSLIALPPHLSVDEIVIRRYLADPM